MLLVAALGLLPPSEAAAADWTTIAEGRVLYTSNVFLLSAARRLSLNGDPSQPALVRLTEPSDVVWTPTIEVRRTSPTRLGDTELSVRTEGYLYTDHSIFDHGDYRFQVKQALSPDTSVLVRYRYVPNLFLGPNIEHQTGSNLVQEERVTSHTWRIQLEQRLAERTTATLLGRYGLRFYNEVFSERDTTFWALGSQVRQQVVSWFGVTLAYLYERGLADGRNQPQFNDDVSYYQHFVSVETTFQVTDPLSLSLNYAYRHKEFTSEIAGDSLRGANDITHQGTVEFRYQVSAAALIMLGLQHSQRTSNTIDRGFNETNTSLGFQYVF